MSEQDDRSDLVRSGNPWGTLPMTPPLPAPADQTCPECGAVVTLIAPGVYRCRQHDPIDPAPVSEADRKLAAEFAREWFMDRPQPARAMAQAMLARDLARLLSSVRQEVREEDCRAVCKQCRAGWLVFQHPSFMWLLADKTRVRMWAHVVPVSLIAELGDDCQCDATPIRSLSLPEPPATETTL